MVLIEALRVIRISIMLCMAILTEKNYFATRFFRRLIDLVVNLQVFTQVFNSEDDPVTLASPHAASFRGKLPARCPESTRLMFVDGFAVSGALGFLAPVRSS